VEKKRIASIALEKYENAQNQERQRQAIYVAIKMKYSNIDLFYLLIVGS
jgi:hypothetical protein